MREQNAPQLTAGFSKIGVHIGSSLMRSAKLYPTVLAAVLEVVQNSVDSNPKNIWVRLNRQRRNLDIADDGDGTTIEQFEEALKKRGQSTKEKDKLGQFGEGLVSPFDKCDVMTFTSCPKGHVNAYMQWAFRESDIAPYAEPRIPREPQPNIRFGNENKTLTIDSKTISQVTWRTKTLLRNYSTDREIGKIGSIDDLAKEIFSRYGSVMRKKKILLHIDFTDEAGKTESKTKMQAPEYTGVRLPEYIAHIDGVRTTFRLYLAKAEGRKGKSNGLVVVGVSDNAFRFAFALLAKNCSEYLAKEMRDALKSGIFEGEIVSGAVTLHENRKQFNVNDGLVNFAKALEQWYQEIGAHHTEEITETKEGARYQKLGLESMRNLEAMLNTSRFSYMKEMFQYMQQGTVGKRHTPAEAIVGLQEVPSQRTKKDTNEKDPRKSSGSTDSKPPGEPKTLTDHHPHTVTGPKGQRRNIVDGGSFGLQFSYEKMPGVSRLWIFDDVMGILRFNVRHPIWVSCDTSDKKIMQLQEHVAIQAVCWFAETATSIVSDAMKDALLSIIDGVIEQQAFMFVHSGSFTIGAPKKIGNESPQ